MSIRIDLKSSKRFRVNKDIVLTPQNAWKSLVNLYYEANTIRSVIDELGNEVPSYKGMKTNEVEIDDFGIWVKNTKVSRLLNTVLSRSSVPNHKMSFDFSVYDMEYDFTLRYYDGKDVTEYKEKELAQALVDKPRMMTEIANAFRAAGYNVKMQQVIKPTKLSEVKINPN